MNAFSMTWGALAMGGVALHGAEVKQANTPFNFPSSSFLPQCIMVKPLIHRWLCVTQLTLYIHSNLLLTQGVFKSLSCFSCSHLDCDLHSRVGCRCIVELQSYRWDQTSLSQMLTTFILYFIQWVHPFFCFFSSQYSRDASVWLQIRLRERWRHPARQEELWLPSLGHSDRLPGENNCLNIHVFFSVFFFKCLLWPV